MSEEITPIIPKPMTRAEKIKIRAERVRKRRIRLGLPPLTTNTDSTVTTAVIVAPKVTVPIIPKELPDIIPDGKLTIEIMIHCFRYQRR